MGHEVGYHYETLDKARGDLDKAIQLNPTFAQAYVARGMISHSMAEPRYANEYYDKAIRVDPHNAEGYAARGKLYSLLSRPEEGDADKAKARSLDKQYC